MLTIEGNSSEYLYQRLLGHVKQGAMTSPRQTTCMEIGTPVCLTLLDTDYNLVTNPYRKLNYAFSLAEVLWIWSGSSLVEPLLPYNKQMAKYSDDGTTLAGAYGPPIGTQITYVLNLLKHDRDTRQAVITIWQPSPKPSKDIPCTIMLHFMVRDFALNLSVYMRSNDAWLGFPYDIFTFTTIQKYMAVLSGFRPGVYNHIVGSMHAYARDLADIENAIKYPGEPVRLPSMHLGDLEYLIEYEEALRLRHKLPQNLVPDSQFSYIHKHLLTAYWSLKRVDETQVPSEFPEPYASLRGEAKNVRAKFKDSKDSRRLETDDRDIRHGR